MTSNQLKIVGAIPLGYFLYKSIVKKNVTPIDNGIAFLGIGIFIYAMTK